MTDSSSTSEAPEEGHTDPPVDHSVSGWVRWLFRPHLAFGGIVIGVIFALWSLTPSLLPRTGVTQGVVTGLAFISGYGLGSAGSALLRRFVIKREPTRRTKRIAWIGLAAVSVLLFAIMMGQSHSWQNQLRDLVDLEPNPDYITLLVLLVAVIAACLVLFGSRLIRSATRATVRQLNRVFSPRISVTVGCVVVALLVIGFAQGVLWRGLVSGMQSLYSTIDDSTAEGAEQQTSSLRSGGPESLMDWNELGRQGRNFTGRGPTRADLEEFHGAGCCHDPIRVYVGLKAAATVEERAQLAIEELDRTGAFDRKVLVLFTATGTGYINPHASNSVEYLFRGDTALVTMQYSYLPSWISVLIDDEPPGEATRALWAAVRDRLEEIPISDRPLVFGFGESLGSFGLERGLGTVEQMESMSDGVLMIGPTYDNPIRQELTRTRVAGSPEWQPLTSMDNVYFAQQPTDLPEPPSTLGEPRVVYLQNASDPVTWWNFGLVALRPDWSGHPHAVDRSPAFRWVPVVSFWQIVGDLPGAGNVPAGFGHIFGANIVDGWLAVSTPDGWTDADTARLRLTLDEQID